MNIYNLKYISQDIISDIALTISNLGNVNNFNEKNNIIFLPSYKINSLQYIPIVRKLITVISDNQNLKNINQTINSIKNQIIKADKIYLILTSKQYKLLSQIEELKKDCEIIITDNYYYPLLTYEELPQTIIIKVHSGFIYPNTLIKSYLACFKKASNYIYGLSLYKYKSINYFQRITINNKLGDNFHSEYSIAFSRSVFKSDFNSYNSIVKFNLINSDNILLLNYLKKYKINLKCLNSKKCNFLLVTNLSSKILLNNKIIKQYYNDILFLKHYKLLYLTNYQYLINYANIYN